MVIRQPSNDAWHRLHSGSTAIDAAPHNQLNPSSEKLSRKRSLADPQTHPVWWTLKVDDPPDLYMNHDSCIWKFKHRKTLDAKAHNLYASF
jgi:hypothetical protein